MNFDSLLADSAGDIRVHCSFRRDTMTRGIVLPVGRSSKAYEFADEALMHASLRSASSQQYSLSNNHGCILFIRALLDTQCL